MIEAGAMFMEATVTAIGAGIPVDDTDPVNFVAVPVKHPEIDIEKYVNGFEADLPVAVTVWVGDSVTFDYKVTNTGNTVLTDITVVDDTIGPRECPKTTLQPGEVMWCTPETIIAEHPGLVVTYATATGIPPGCPPVEDTDAGKFRVVDWSYL